MRASASPACSARRASVLQWNPEGATQLVVASDDDRSPTLQMWDLRNSVAPLKEFVGHTKVGALASCSRAISAGGCLYRGTLHMALSEQQHYIHQDCYPQGCAGGTDQHAGLTELFNSCLPAASPAAMAITS
jgi:hypothetical protein